MIRTIQDFLDRWNYESASTIKVFENLTNESLMKNLPGTRTIGRLANHLVETITELPHKLGVPIEEEQITYVTVQNLIDNYERVSDLLVNAVKNNWTDDMLEEETEMYGQQWKKGFGLFALLMHQAHHRGQMTTLMRSNGLKVPGIYGPSREEWIAYNMAPQE
jgi:uncharacterized damage-inducible protein DinB